MLCQLIQVFIGSDQEYGTTCRVDAALKEIHRRCKPGMCSSQQRSDRNKMSHSLPLLHNHVQIQIIKTSPRSCVRALMRTHKIENDDAALQLPVTRRSLTTPCTALLTTLPRAHSLITTALSLFNDAPSWVTVCCINTHGGECCCMKQLLNHFKVLICMFCSDRSPKELNKHWWGELWQAIMVPRRWITIMLLTLWCFLVCHQQDDISRNIQNNPYADDPLLYITKLRIKSNF